MACFSLKQSTCSHSGGLLFRRSPRPIDIKSLSPKNYSLKPLHLSSSAGNTFPYFPTVKKNKSLECSCSAESAESNPATVQKNKLLDFLFFKPEPYKLGRWSYKVIFTAIVYATYTLHSKMILNSLPCPWLLATIYHVAGFFTFGVICGYAPQDTDDPFWESLVPVSIGHTIGLVAELISLSKMSAPSTHIIRCAEPVFQVLLSMLLEGQSFPMSVYLSLLPIIGGVALATCTDLSFNLIGFITAMIANLAYAYTNIAAERGMKKEKGVKVMSLQYYGCLSLLSIFIIVPFALVMEGPRKWAAGLKMATSTLGAGALTMLIVSLSTCYHLYNEETYDFFPNLPPFPFLTVNTAKKIFVIVGSMIFLGTHVQPISALGAAMAILGIFLYSREMCKISRITSWYL